MPKPIIAFILAALAVQLAQSADGKRRRPSPTSDRPKIWNRTGPLGETPKRITDAYPLSDQQNKGGWVKFEPMSDEFEGKELDRKKWVMASKDGRVASLPCLAKRTSPSRTASCT